mmetsp:Transcript_9150/g.22543  ORF Transcript_9150/g.22543 Transcript_9150/m.22543 type:complete len:238 (-) Transcript_9150:895-1608(-)
MRRMSRRSQPIKPAPNTMKLTPNMTPAPMREYPPPMSIASSMSFCAFCTTSFTFTAASFMFSVLFVTLPPVFSVGSLAATERVSAILRTLAVRSATVLVKPLVRSLVLSRSGPVSAKTMKQPMAVKTQKPNMTNLLMSRSRLLKLRGLYAPLQHLHSVAPQTLLTTYTKPMSTIATSRIMAIAMPGRPWPRSEPMYSSLVTSKPPVYSLPFKGLTRGRPRTVSGREGARPGGAGFGT